MARHSLFNFLGIFFVVFGLSACKPFLYARVETVNQHSLVSYRVSTPDPRKVKPRHGAKLIVSWALPLTYPLKGNEKLSVSTLFGDSLQKQYEVDIKSRTGYWQLFMSDQELKAHQNLLSYSLLLKSGDEVLKQWDHLLWAEMISLERIDVDEPIVVEAEGG
jgi:hypothetical protein